MIYRKMHPLIFNKQDIAPYEKIQNDWIFQYLDGQHKRDYIQSRQPKHLLPSKVNYSAYLTSVINYAKEHPNEEILSIQTFACHGKLLAGCQAVLVNKISANGFYEMIPVELNVRLESPKAKNVYFLTLFACCREPESLFIRKAIAAPVEKPTNSKEEQ